MHVRPDEYDKYPGASHCDELPYIFKTGAETNIDSPSLDSKEFGVIKSMVDTFTTFAATGDPNNNQLKGKWDELKPDDSPVKCLNITGDEAKMVPLPEAKKLETWNEIFRKENVQLY